MLKELKILCLKIYCDIVIIADGKSDLIDRFESFFRSLFNFPLIAFFVGIMTKWYMTNQTFVIFIVLAITINMIFGGWMHYKKSSFKMQVFLNKTSVMVVSVLVTYFALEMVITLGGKNIVTQGFRMALQVSTLLYPVGKIAKNGFILSKGEYPPEWIMKRIYSFQQNGDLKEFFSEKNDKNTNEYED